MAVDRVDRSGGGAWRSRAGWLAVVALLAALLVSVTALAAAPADVAVVAGKPIPRRVFDHWMMIAVKGQGGPVVVPLQPPRFDRCIEQARTRVASLRHESTKVLRKGCQLLFHALRGPVLDFLIRTAWQEAEAARDGIVVTAAQVDRAFAAQRHRLFPKAGEFRRFLKNSGQSVADVKFRVRASLVVKALQKSEHLSEDALEAELTRRFKPHTTCARYYAITDCAPR